MQSSGSLPQDTHTLQVASPSSLALPKFHNYGCWDRALVRFLKTAGLVQALSGFESDMLVMNPDSEKEDIHPALERLYIDLTEVSQCEQPPKPQIKERKLDYVRLANSEAMPVTHTQLTKSISVFIAQNRARNNVSNRNEFLRKRRRVDLCADTTALEDPSFTSEDLPTCARTDALPVNRDVQMKYDIAKNEGGPLRRTVKSERTDVDAHADSGDRKCGDKGKATSFHDGDGPTLQRHPGLRERFANLEDHLAVRYVPSPPASLLERMRFLEDHIIRLERDYPPWAALHFKQPNRGWPPPPRATPLIVPPRLISTFDLAREEHAEDRDLSQSTSTAVWSAEPTRPSVSRASGSKPRTKAKSSSLQRAVMQKLEVKKALNGED